MAGAAGEEKGFENNGFIYGKVVSFSAKRLICFNRFKRRILNMGWQLFHEIRFVLR